MDEAIQSTKASKGEHLLQMSESKRSMEHLANANVRQDVDMKAMATQLASIQKVLTALSGKVESSSRSSNTENDTIKSRDSGR